MRAIGHVALAVSLTLSAGCERVGLAGRGGDRLGEDETVEAVAEGEEPGPAPAAMPDVSGTASWDGVPSLGGAWVAHPDVVEPVRVRIARADGRASVQGWLFRRDGGGEGPALQVSSEAAEALGLTPGQSVELTVEREG